MYDLEGPEQAEFIEEVVEVQKQGKEALRWNLDELVVGESRRFPLSLLRSSELHDVYISSLAVLTLGSVFLLLSSSSQTPSQRSVNPTPTPPPSSPALLVLHPTSIAKPPN